MKYVKIDDLKYQWNRTRFLVKEKVSEIPDVVGYWTGSELTIDSLDPGEYFWKFSKEDKETKEENYFNVENEKVINIPIDVGGQQKAIYIYKSNGIFVGKVRIAKKNERIDEDTVKKFIEEYAQPKGDYLTTDDKDEIIDEMKSILTIPIFGIVDNDNNIVLTGNLSDGTYTLKYEQNNGELIDIGNITIDTDTDENIFTNQISNSTDLNGDIYNSKGYKENTRISASSGTISENESVDLTGFIPVKFGDIVYMKNVAFVWSTIGSNGGLHFYKADKTTKVLSVNNSIYQESSITSGLNCEYDETGNLVKFIVNPFGSMTADDAAYLRVCANDITDNSIITINEKII